MRRLGFLRPRIPATSSAPGLLQSQLRACGSLPVSGRGLLDRVRYAFDKEAAASAPSAAATTHATKRVISDPGGGGEDGGGNFSLQTSYMLDQRRNRLRSLSATRFRVFPSPPTASSSRPSHLRFSGSRRTRFSR